MNKVICAVVGAGWWGTTAHVPALLRHRHAHLVAIQHHQATQAKRTARNFGVSNGWSDVNRVWEIPDLQAVVISSTPHLHYPQAKAALQRGLHVLLEKPMCISAAQSRELVDLANKKRLHLMLSAPWHFTAHSVIAQQLVSGGDLGQLKMISILMTNFSASLYHGRWIETNITRNKAKEIEGSKAIVRPGRSSYSDPRIAGGGQIYCQVSHPAMYLSFLTGRKPVEVFARFDHAGASVDVFNDLSIKLDDGTLVSLASHGAPMPSDRQYEIRVYGTRGMLLMDLWKGAMEFHNQRGKVTRYRTLQPDKVFPLHAPAMHFIDTVVGSSKNRSPGTHGIVAMQIIEAACRSARVGRNIKIPQKSDN